jgi:hypothetical protein
MSLIISPKAVNDRTARFMKGWAKIPAIADKNCNDGIDNLVTVLATWDNI